MPPSEVKTKAKMMISLRPQRSQALARGGCVADEESMKLFEQEVLAETYLDGGSHDAANDLDGRDQRMLLEARRCRALQKKRDMSEIFLEAFESWQNPPGKYCESDTPFARRSATVLHTSSSQERT